MMERLHGAPSAYYCAALYMTLRELPPGPTSDLIRHAIDAPTPEAIRAVLTAGLGQPWRIRIEHALIEVGIAATVFLECRS